MCLSPISVDISKRTYIYNVRGFIPSYSSVPCGICSECTSSSRNEYFVRLYAEYRNCIDNGGKVLFPTFTYSDDNVPYVSYCLNDSNNDIEFSTHFGNIGNHNCLYTFHKPHLQTFFNSLRKFFERSFGITDCFRYFVVGEYGSDDAYTQRPHYHCLFFVSSELCKFFNNFDALGCLDFLRICQRYWKYGMVSESTTHGLVVRDSSCCSYVSKYVTKSLSLLDLRRFKAFYSFLKDNFDSLEPEDFIFSKSVKSLFKYYMRVSQCRFFILKSKSFGSSILNQFDNLSNIQIVNNLIQGFPIPDIKNGQVFYYSYPKYIVNKLLFRNDLDGFRVLTSRGYQLKKLLMLELIKSSVRELDFLDLSLYSSFVSRCKFDVLPYDSFLCYLRNRSFLYDYYLYVYFLRNRYFPEVFDIFDFDNPFNSLSSFDERFNYVFSCCYSHHLDVIEKYDIVSYDYVHSVIHPYVGMSPIKERFYTTLTNFLIYCRKHSSDGRLSSYKRSKTIKDILFNY